jgi:tRNA dimethylallyltransferase
MRREVIAVVGATATGKSDLAVELARILGGEVVNADSMQLYRGMDIGTAKLTMAERRSVPHHLLDVWDVTKAASVAEYQRLANAVIDDILARGKVPVLAGGSGLYGGAWKPNSPTWVPPRCTPAWLAWTPEPRRRSCRPTAAGSSARSR